MNTSLKTLRIAVYVALVVLINVAAATLFFRVDMTANAVYTLSEASRSVVSTLQEPLTIKAYFSPNLPPPYNNTEQQFRDLLEEYGEHANRFFNYSISTVSPEEDADNQRNQALKREAQNYGIYPVQIQNIERDEVKLQTAYMGAVFIHGDLTETLPALTQGTNLEYRITQIIQGMSNKISALLALETDIRVELFLSSNLFALSDSLRNLPRRIEELVSSLNRENYDRLSYAYRDPYTEPELTAEAADRDVAVLKLRQRTGDEETLEDAYAGLVISNQDGVRTVDLFRRGLFGDLQLEAEETLSAAIQDSAERLIGLNQEIGYLSAYGTRPLTGQGGGVNNLRAALSEGYEIREITLDQTIPEDIGTLIIAGPTETFSDYALYELDQFLIKGNSLAVFLDTHREVSPQGSQAAFGQQPQYVPIQTGLETMLRHYGVGARASYVLDENCFRQVHRLSDGSLSEIPFYFYPMVPMGGIARELPYLQGIKGLIMLNVSPLELTGGNGTPTELAASSDTAWEMSENINLYNPLFISPPSSPEQRGSRPLAYLLEGEFTSYFRGRDIPARPAAEEDQAGALGLSAEDVALTASFRERTTSGRLLLIGSSAILDDAVIDQDSSNPNTAFVLNLIDALSGREDYAVMRSKGQSYNPLKETTSSTKRFVKSFNIAALPILAALAGLLVWASWLARKRRIQAAFLPAPRSDQS